MNSLRSPLTPKGLHLDVLFTKVWIMTIKKTLPVGKVL